MLRSGLYTFQPFGKHLSYLPTIFHRDFPNNVLTGNEYKQGDGLSLSEVNIHASKTFKYPCIENRTLYIVEELYAYLYNIDKKLTVIYQNIEDIQSRIRNQNITLTDIEKSTSYNNTKFGNLHEQLSDMDNTINYISKQVS